MNKLLLFRSIPFVITEGVREFEKQPEKVASETDALLDLIFGVDPVSGVPHNDLGYFLNDKSNVEIRNFIQQNLLQDRGGDTPSSLPDSITNQFKSVIGDDDIAKYSRNDGETSEAYAMRLRGYFDEHRKSNQFKRYLAQRQKEYGVS